ncbi:MAG: hypothetical protein HHAS10_07450 [Candidatus Altimarinota bacterium]
MSKYFKNSSYTENSLKKEYRKLAQIYHPDKGGKASIFKEMKEEYEVILKQLKNNTYTAEPIKAEKTYQKTPQQTKTTKTEPKKKKQEPINHIEPDFVFLRSMFKKVRIFSIKHPRLCSNTIHTTLAIIFGLLGIILFLGSGYILAGILLVYSFTTLIIFKHYLFTFLLALVFTQFGHTQNPEYFITIILVATIFSMPFILVRADDATPNFYH